MLQVKCRICLQEKDENQFYRRHDTSSIRQPCKKCHLTKTAQNYSDNQEHYQQKRKEHYASKPEWYKQRDAKTRRTPEDLARRALKQAVHRGTIIKPEICQNCHQPTKKKRLQGHHTDYSKPYDVQWLCQICHAKFQACFK